MQTTAPPSEPVAAPAAGERGARRGGSLDSRPFDPWLVAALAVALVVRLAHWWAVRDQPFFALLTMDSEAYDRWAQEIAAGDWLGSEPFFQAPLYPYLLALLYATFGRHLDIVYLLQIGAALAGLWVLYRAGGALLDPVLGRIAAFGGALYGPFVFYDVQVLKASLSVTFTCVLLWLLIEGRRRTALRWWWCAGFALGALILLRENGLLLTPVVPLLALRPGSSLCAAGVRSGALLGGVVLALLPVAARNAWVGGGGLLPTTYQGGVSFWMGNNPEATGRHQPLVTGRQIPAFERRDPVRLAEQDLGRELTGAEVSRYWLQRSLRWARAEPGAFALLQLRKLGLFWSFREEPDALDYEWVRGISPVLRLKLLEFGAVAVLAGLGLWWIRARLDSFAPILLFVAAWTAATVVFFVFGRFRLPVVPGLLLIAALPIHRMVLALRQREHRPAIALAVCALLAWLLPHALPREPATALVSFNLGVIYEQAGDLSAAERAYRDALIADPGEYHAAVNLGHLALRVGRLEDARALFAHAVSLAPDFVDAWVSLGVVDVLRGDLDAGQHSLERALLLQVDHLDAVHNLSVIALERGDTSGARELNRRALELDPSHDPALRMKRLLAGRDGDAASPQ